MDATIESARSADGTKVGWERHGAGPVIAVLHGGARAGKHYRELAKALMDRFTVVLPDRRGRGLTGPSKPGDGIREELADLAAIFEATGAQCAFGQRRR